MDNNLIQIIQELSKLEEKDLRKIFNLGLFQKFRVEKFNHGYRQGKYDEALKNCFGEQLGGNDIDY